MIVDPSVPIRFQEVDPAPYRQQRRLLPASKRLYQPRRQPQVEGISQQGSEFGRRIPQQGRKRERSGDRNVELVVGEVAYDQVSNANKSTIHLSRVVRKRLTCERVLKVMVVPRVEGANGRDDLPAGAVQVGHNSVEERPVLRPAQGIDPIYQDDTWPSGPGTQDDRQRRVELDPVEARDVRRP
ncbi:hypothetical protein GCM10009557_00880 [Virgisporangium ochraceum]|uniref:Uncharacterized protein n=1 Tax=Virgisporangium ochraceum TaxID=65505 RepID=A0A8J4A6A4_9ACTN|nr:hypothetical protein Voc01_090370 [Virgisporangium ochraceum]